MRNGNYELVKAPDNYIGRKYRGKYCYEHHLVYWKETGMFPGRDEVVHHINGNTRDNKFENLELQKKKDHCKYHSSTGRTMIILTCAFCGRVFRKERRQAHGIKKNQRDFYCNRHCMAKHFGGRRSKK